MLFTKSPRIVINNLVDVTNERKGLIGGKNYNMQCPFRFFVFLNNRASLL